MTEKEVIAQITTAYHKHRLLICKMANNELKWYKKIYNSTLYPPDVEEIIADLTEVFVTVAQSNKIDDRFVYKFIARAKTRLTKLRTYTVNEMPKIQMPEIDITPLISEFFYQQRISHTRKRQEDITYLLGASGLTDKELSTMKLMLKGNSVDEVAVRLRVTRQRAFQLKKTSMIKLNKKYNEENNESTKCLRHGLRDDFNRSTKPST